MCSSVVQRSLQIWKRENEQETAFINNTPVLFEVVTCQIACSEKAVLNDGVTTGECSENDLKSACIYVNTTLVRSTSRLCIHKCGFFVKFVTLTSDYLHIVSINVSSNVKVLHFFAEYYPHFLVHLYLILRT